MKRNDARQIYDIPLYNKIFPFMLKRRCDSLVFYANRVDVSKTVAYIRNYNAAKPEMRLRFFYVFCAALMRTLAMRPEMNRFIAARRYWQRNELSMNFVVKEDMSDDSPETSSPLYFRPEMTLLEYARIMDDYVNRSRNDSTNNTTDAMINSLMHIPYWMIGAFVKIMGFFERLGLSAKFVRDADGLHTSVFVSNLGSLGIRGGSPHHHLYEWGTTSLFVTLGSMEREKEFDDNGKVVSIKEFVEVGITVDERVSSGFYFVKSMAYLQYLLENPEELEKVPELPPPPLTKKEWKAKLKAAKREKRVKK